ncbi:hypothetical protein B0T26DRAFT_688175 [Lasiosphaeria miniovina]|uniref:Uncharacterized protein n=1 Tax=Lasiosphaeria miniovina TaxID=1954250 RepID=A0AA40BHI5_9PEZI|nr:uncharacterized protein B0T26DRAFT_688175 [Lasiosphaeria miniovina]KAK0734341.1 hypothetical protein B0T26DRAFT_688175 [Lasiosphaeria miniovina]
MWPCVYVGVSTLPSVSTCFSLDFVSDSQKSLCVRVNMSLICGTGQCWNSLSCLRLWHPHGLGIKSQNEGLR